MAVRYGTLVRYVTLQFLLRGTIRWYGTPFLEWYGYGTLVRYASKIELKYGTLVRYGSRCEVRSTQIPNVPYRTAILGNRSLKINSENIKNYSLILIIVNHRNWLDD